MPVLLALVFVGVPLLELAVILQVGGVIGGWWTAALLILFSVVGAMLLRFEGRRAWSEFRRALGEGRWPGDEVAQGALIIVGGTLLVTPGFLTDLVGFVLLLGPSRRLVARQVRVRMTGSIVTGGLTGPGPDGVRRGSHRPDQPGPTQDGPSRRGPDPGGPNRGGPSRRGSYRGGSSQTGDGVPLEVEVVEIRREQPPLDGSGSGPGEVDPDLVEDVEIDDDRPGER